MEKLENSENRIFNKIKENIAALSCMFSIGIINTGYGLLNNSHRGVYSLLTDIDRNTPFIKEFSVPYLIWYPFIVITLIYFCFKDREVYYKTLISINIGMLISFLIYFLFQTTVPRPEVMGSDIFSRLVSLVYKTDKPFNCFPSIHVITSYLMIKGVNRSKVRNKLNYGIITLISTLIILSTLFIKQHVIMDAAGAIVLSSLIFRLVDSVQRERVLIWIKRQYSSLTMKKKLEI